MTPSDFFYEITGRNAYPFQVKLAENAVFSRAIPAATGTGKTAAAIVAWLYRRLVDPLNTPRRLVYCLPMRVLVEQTRQCAAEWLLRAANLGVRARVYTLMGGELEEEWETQPDEAAVLIGTQDMLLSRALNRGFGMSRYQWPVHFGLLNNDVLWVCDEVQLMGSGLATTAQLAAWREQWHTFGPVATWWMSATMERGWLETVDFARRAKDLPLVQLDQKDRERLQRQWEASKPLERRDFGTERHLAQEICKRHQPGSLTLIIVNTVERAQQLFEELASKRAMPPGAPERILVHSRFRAHDRDQISRRLASPVSEQSPGRIVVATQVVEAGVDISARTLFTDLAPWPSMVQRFGRANRYGESAVAPVIWIDLPANKARPYEEAELSQSRERLLRLNDVGLTHLETYGAGPIEPPLHVVRRKDLIELFDTTPDLGGSDVDVSRFIRDGEDLDAQVFWRDVAQRPPGEDEPRPASEEFCPVPVRDVDAFLKDRGEAYRWNGLNAQWEPARRTLPGQTYLLPAEFGGYTPDRGWSPKIRLRVTPASVSQETPESYRSDELSRGVWLTIAEHTGHVVEEIAALARELGLDAVTTELLGVAARWHDRGKGHPEFQTALPSDERHPPGHWAKAADQFRRYRRPQFRHELASALAVLQERSGLIPERLRDLVAYLVASHHGKVRLSIRSIPGEIVPEGRRFARGVWDRDRLAELDLGGGVIAPEVFLTLDPMEVGLGANGQPSWAERMIRLRDSSDWRVFRLAYLEALLRAADRRASAKEAASA
jgi:CRISPR-associated endonuclease/helicase Cas3